MSITYNTIVEGQLLITEDMNENFDEMTRVIENGN